MAKSTLFHSVKFKMLVRALGMPEPHVLGHLQYMWMPAYESGNPTFRSVDEIEIAAGWIGEPGRFADAVTNPNHAFVDRCDDGGFVIHDFWEHAPEYVKKREKYKKENQRKVVKRRVSSTFRVGKSRKVSENGGNFPPTEPNRTEPNLTQPNQAETDPPDPPLPAPIAQAARPSAPVPASALSRGTQDEKSRQREREVDIRIERFMQFESERNRGPATAIMWRTRVRAMARLPGGLVRCDEIADEIESRRNRRVAESKGFSTDRIENEAAWANQQTESWLKKHEPKGKAQ